MAIVAYFAYSVQEYEQHFAAWVIAVKPERCPHCNREHTTILWSCYTRWVYTHTDFFQIRIKRVRCTHCGVTDALLPSFLHMFRRYTLVLIQLAILLVLDHAVWGQALVDQIAPYNQPAPATLREWLWSFALSAETWLLVWLQKRLPLLVAPEQLDPGQAPPHLVSIPSARRRQAFLHAWQVLRLTETLYALERTRQPDLAFQFETLLAFLAAALTTSQRPPRILWPAGSPRPP